METSNEREYQERRVGPTVSKEKWVNHAKTKMGRGYVLIVGNERRNANFYLRDKGYEMCPFNVAKQLIRDGIVVEAGTHQLGTVYHLAAPPAPPEPKPASGAKAAPDDLDAFLEELEDNDTTEDSSSPAF